MIITVITIIITYYTLFIHSQWTTKNYSKQFAIDNKEAAIFTQVDDGIKVSVLVTLILDVFI